MTRHYTFTVEVPDESDPGDWAFVRALLDAIEPGASGHCLGREYGTNADYHTHHRLGVIIGSRVVERR
jgi:hypothetical protein